ncbi:hypothetical protein Anas_07640, partial [Armadillidium nasatum]
MRTTGINFIPFHIPLNQVLLSQQQPCVPQQQQQETSQSLNSSSQHHQSQLQEGEAKCIKEEEDSHHGSNVPTSRPDRDLPPASIPSLESRPPSGEERDLQESDIDMSEDEDDCRSRESGGGVAVDINKPWGPPSPVMSHGSLSLPPYPSLPGLGQP